MSIALIGCVELSAVGMRRHSSVSFSNNDLHAYTRQHDDDCTTVSWTTSTLQYFVCAFTCPRGCRSEAWDCTTCHKWKGFLTVPYPSYRTIPWVYTAASSEFPPTPRDFPVTVGNGSSCYCTVYSLYGYRDMQIPYRSHPCELRIPSRTNYRDIIVPPRNRYT